MPATSWVGLALGVVGALLLALEGDFSASGLGALLALARCAGASAPTPRKLSLPAPAMASGAQWLTGGAMGMVVALMVEPVGALADVSARSWLAWVYLLGLGTLVALNYLWLLQNTSAALAGSYSFVNPAVALLVGVALGASGSRLGLCGPALIGAALALLLYGPLLLQAAQRLRARMPGDHAGRRMLAPDTDSTLTMLYKFKSVPRPT
jgi:drug/metabolite transporter (DMT)-like permease